MKECQRDSHSYTVFIRKISEKDKNSRKTCQEQVENELISNIQNINLRSFSILFGTKKDKRFNELFFLYLYIFTKANMHVLIMC